jgi:MazG family protein
VTPFERLLGLVAKLRAETGCPWDREQDHRSLRPYVLEEAYEVIAAIDAADTEALVDELGDLLLQVLLHSQIASERGAFSVEDVIDRLARKLIRRHPHVFDAAPKTMSAVRETWHAVKRNEKGVRHPLPPLLEARKLVERLRDLTFIENQHYPTDEAREGSKLLKAIALTWEKGIDPEIALRQALAQLGTRNPEQNG